MDIKDIMALHDKTGIENYDSELVESIQKAAYNSLAHFGIPSYKLQVNYIREIAPHFYAVRFLYKEKPESHAWTGEDGLYIAYFHHSLYIDSASVARRVRKMLDR